MCSFISQWVCLVWVQGCPQGSVNSIMFVYPVPHSRFALNRGHFSKRCDETQLITVSNGHFVMRLCIKQSCWWLQLENDKQGVLSTQVLTIHTHRLLTPLFLSPRSNGCNCSTRERHLSVMKQTTNHINPNSTSLATHPATRGSPLDWYHRWGPTWWLGVRVWVALLQPAGYPCSCLKAYKE